MLAWNISPAILNDKAVARQGHFLSLLDVRLCDVQCIYIYTYVYIYVYIR